MRRLLILGLFVLAGIAAQAQTPLWVFGSQSSILFDPTVGPDGTSYYTTVDNKIAAVSSSGVYKWAADLGAQAMTPIALQGTTLFVGTSSQQIRAYSVAGNVVWKTVLEKNIKTPIAVASDNTLYFGLENGQLYAVNGNTGKVNWHFYVDTMMGPPTVSHTGNVYVAGSAFMHSINAKTGQVIWRKDVFNFSNVPLAMDNYDNMVYIRRGIMDIYDYRGNFLWEAYDDTGALILIQNVQPLIYGDILVAAVQGGGDIYGFDSRTGQIVWQFSKVNATNPITWTPKAVSSMAVDSRGMVTYCDTTAGQIAFFDAATGWFLSFMPSNGLGNSFALVGMGTGGYGVIRAGTGNKTLVGYKMPAGPGSPWSQWGGTAYKQMRRDDPPYLTLSQPLDGQVITGAFCAVATASDDFSLADLSIYMNGTQVAKSGGGSVSLCTNSASFQDGVYDIVAVARDSGGNQATASASVAFVNPPPVYGVSYGAPIFSWIKNGVDNKYEVDISLSPSFGPVLVSSATPSKNFVKGTTWQPSQNKWAKVQNAAKLSAPTQTTFYWRVVGKSGGLVTTRSFIMDKTK